VDREKILEEAKLHFSTKLKALDTHIKTVQDAANQESKSSVGDKYETGRAMAQNEVFQLKVQYEALRHEVEKLFHLPSISNPDQANNGSLVKTKKGWFLLGAALGKFMYGSTSVYFISLDSPLGSALTKKKKEEEFLVNEMKDKIVELL
jgi:hypothetical protein